MMFVVPLLLDTAPFRVAYFGFLSRNQSIVDRVV